MEYIIHHKEDLNMVIATAKGEWDSKTDDAMVHEIMEMVDSTKSKKTLLDIRELRFYHPVLQVFERAQVIKKQRQEFKNVSRKVAIVYPATDEKIDENIKFFETVARNRGMPYRAFTDVDAAMAWLVEP